MYCWDYKSKITKTKRNEKKVDKTLELQKYTKKKKKGNECEK